MVVKLYFYEKKRAHVSADTDSMIIESVRRYLSDKKIDVSVGRLPSGKPYLEKINGIFIGVTHTEKKVFIALSDRELGIDAERCERAFEVGDFKRIAKRFFTPAESEMIGNSRERFLEIWVKKEAYAKCFGMGIGEMRSFSVLDAEGIFVNVENSDDLIILYFPYRERNVTVVCE